MHNQQYCLRFGVLPERMHYEVLDCGAKATYSSKSKNALLANEMPEKTFGGNP